MTHLLRGHTLTHMHTHAHEPRALRGHTRQAGACGQVVWRVLPLSEKRYIMYMRYEKI